MRRCRCSRLSSLTCRIKALSCHHHRTFNDPNLLVAADWFNKAVAKNPMWILYLGASSWPLRCRRSGCWWQILSGAQKIRFLDQECPKLGSLLRIPVEVYNKAILGKNPVLVMFLTLIFALEVVRVGSRDVTRENSHNP
eukprot:scaffold4821_cov76-Cylindrotheca_fusiformis.AAC.2